MPKPPRIGEGDFCFVVDAVEGQSQSVFLYMDLWHGQCRDAAQMADETSRVAGYRLSAPLAVWKKNLAEAIGSMQGMMGGQLKLKRQPAHAPEECQSGQRAGSLLYLGAHPFLGLARNLSCCACLADCFKVDLTTGATTLEMLPADLVNDYIGGSSLGARLLWDYADAGLDPLAPANPLVWLTGPLTGTNGPATGRSVVCGRSPQTGFVGRSEHRRFCGVRTALCWL